MRRAPSSSAVVLPATGPLETDRNLLFGVLAVQLEFIDAEQFSQACAGWAVAKHRTLGDQLVERGWLTAADKLVVEMAIEQKRKKYRGSIPATLAASADHTLREAMRRSGDAEVRRSLEQLPDRPTPDATKDAATVGASSRYGWMGLYREGALGQVWVGRDHQLNRDVALKVVAPDRLNPSAAERQLVVEAQVTGQLEHPNIVPVYELGRRAEDGRPFYAMRLLGEQTLGDAIARHHQNRSAGRPDPLSRRRLLGSFLGVCNAVAYAHSRGVIHRDLKPENVVLGHFGEVYLIDWGLARLLRSPNDDTARVTVSVADGVEAPASGRGPGTPAYMAPEQAANRSELMGIATDVYGLGAILFELLTGKAPHEIHEGDKLEVVLQRIAEKESPSAREREPAVPPALDQICARAMARVPEDRYPGAAELGAAVQRWLDEEPIAAYRAAVSYFERLVEQFPRMRSYREGLACNLVNLGLVLSGLDRNADSELAYRAAIGYFEALTSAHPLVPNYRAQLAAARLHLRNTLLVLGRQADAEEMNRAALADYEKLIQALPGDRHYRSQLASVLSVLGHAPEEVQRRLKDLGPEEEPEDDAQAGGAQGGPSDTPTPPAPAEAAAELPSQEPAASGESNDDLLFGVLALQMDFVNREQYLEALQVWMTDRTRPLAYLLLEQGALTADQLGLVEAMVRRQREPLPASGDAAGPPSVAGASVGDQLRSLAGVSDNPATMNLQDSVPGPFATIPPQAFGTSPLLGEASSGPRYRLLRRHATGGLGEVFVAEDESLGREVAIKQMRNASATAASTALFVREAEITAQLEHPSIVPVYSLGRQADGRPYYAMRFIRGDTYHSALRRFHADTPPTASATRTLGFRKLLGSLIEVCNAVAYAHKRGVIHRDIKPHNILLGPFGETLLVDWGLAKVLAHPDPSEVVQSADLPVRPRQEAPYESEGTLMGTPSFMSPEQAQGRANQLGPATDIYSLGATLYVLLTGHEPFPGVRIVDIIERARQHDFLPPRQVVRSLPRQLEAICLRAMAREPLDRYPTAQSLADDLERWLADEPVSARRDSLTEKVARWARHHPLAFALAIVLLLVAVLVAVAIFSGAAPFTD